MLQFTLVIIVLAAQLPALRRQWLEDRAGAVKSWRLLAYYFLYLGVGLAVLLGALRNGGSEAAALAGMAFILGWVLLGVSTLIKVVPRYRPVPAWLLKPVGILDVVALAAIVPSLVVLFR